MRAASANGHGVTLPGDVYFATNPQRRKSKKRIDFAAAIEQASVAQGEIQRSLPSDVGDSPDLMQPFLKYRRILPPSFIVFLHRPLEIVAHGHHPSQRQHQALRS